MSSTTQRSAKKKTATKKKSAAKKKTATPKNPEDERRSSDSGEEPSSTAPSTEMVELMKRKGSRADPGSEEFPKITDWFDRVFVINCKHRPDRLVEFMAEIVETDVADIEKITVYPGIIGDYTTHPAGWPSGNGAWGCLQSHRRIMEDLMHDRDDREVMTWDRALILEDDVFFLAGALKDLNDFMLNIPDDWGQAYIGGQHRADVTPTDSEFVVKANSVNRTHAYAITKDYIQVIYRHISYMKDYHSQKHIDHQLELAHQRGDWPVYSPPKWICGQRAGESNISGRRTPDMTWQ